MQLLKKHTFPEIGALPVERVGHDGVLRILKPLWSTRPQLARKLRQRIHATLQWCQVHGHVGANVAGEAIDGTLPAMPAVKAHYRALPWAEVGAALDAVCNAPGISESSRLCLDFLVLTAARSGEALGAAWDEIDFAGREWRIPAEHMKTGTPHAVPLAAAALRTLGAARDLGGERFVFPSPARRGVRLGESSLLYTCATPVSPGAPPCTDSAVRSGPGRRVYRRRPRGDATVPRPHRGQRRRAGVGQKRPHGQAPGADGRLGRDRRRLVADHPRHPRSFVHDAFSTIGFAPKPKHDRPRPGAASRGRGGRGVAEL